MRRLKDKEVDELLEAKIIDAFTAENIKKYYQSNSYTKEWSQTIFSIIGALLLGLGMILLIAHNWDDLPKGIKTTFGFMPLLIGQGLLLYSLLKKKRNQIWLEGSSIILYLGIGATMAMIAQIYQISGDEVSFFKTWILLGLPILYVAKSRTISMFHVIATTYLATLIAWEYPRETPYIYLLFMLLLLPYYYWCFQKNIDLVLNYLNKIILISLPLVISLFFKDNAVHYSFLAHFALYSFYIALGTYASPKHQLKLFKYIGQIATLVILYIYTYENKYFDYDNTFLILNNALFVFCLFSALTLYIVLKNSSLNVYKLYELSFIPFFFIISLIIIGASDLAIIVSNLMIFLIAISKIFEGLKKLSLSILNYGILILCVLIVLRYFDSNLSFIFKGITFMLLGGAFIYLNYKMIKKQQKINP